MDHLVIMGILDCRTDAPAECDALLDGEVSLGEVSVERLPIDQFQGDEELTVRRTRWTLTTLIVGSRAATNDQSRETRSGDFIF